MNDLHAQIMNLPCKAYDGTDAYTHYCRGHRDARHAAAELALAHNARIRQLERVLEAVIQATHSHIDGRDLLAELHPRNTLDIKRRKDSVEKWFEGDWLSTLWSAVKAARAALKEQS